MDDDAEKRPRGHPPHEKTDENIKLATSLASYGVPTIQIAAALEISEATLFKYYKEDMIKARSFANAKIGQTLYQKAKSGDTRAMIWWTKAQMGWAEPTKEEKNHAIEVNLVSPKAEMSDAELSKRVQFLLSNIEAEKEKTPQFTAEQLNMLQPEELQTLQRSRDILSSLEQRLSMEK